MGFRLKRIYNITFDGNMEGAEVNIRTTPIAVVIQLGSTRDLREIAELLCTYVESWNLDGLDGEPLKMVPEAVLENLEQVVLQRICEEWYAAARGITAPLDPPSTDGSQSKEETSLDLSEIPMQPLDLPES
jgi:hypothetical protein